MTITDAKVSSERLAHFTCTCGKRFTITDAPLPAAYHCPWCGKQSMYAMPVTSTETTRPHEQVAPI